jgi:hypothetical protein
MSLDGLCPCGFIVHPQPILNPHGLSEIAYRGGDFVTFRHALLLSRPNETALAAWRPGAEGDLTVQLIEWWAVLADILTFYNERAMTLALLRTADLPEAAQNLVRLVGYRPRPAIAARGMVAALVSGTKPVVLPKGFAVQSKPGPGKQPQVFETDADATLAVIDSIAVDPPSDGLLTRVDDGKSSVLLSGAITSIKKGDRLLLRKRTWDGSADDYRLAAVELTRKEKTARGQTNTRLIFSADLGLPNNEVAASWLLLRATQTAKLFSPASAPIDGPIQVFFVEALLATGTSAKAEMQALALEAAPAGSSGAKIETSVGKELVVSTGAVSVEEANWNEFHLDGVKSPITAGDAFVATRSTSTVLAHVLSHRQKVWYANAPDPAAPQTPPASTSAPPFAVYHSVVRTNEVLGAFIIGEWNTDAAAVSAQFGWVEVGTLIGSPPKTLAIAANATVVPLTTVLPAVQANVELEDVNGLGADAKVDNASLASIALRETAPVPQTLTAPLRLLMNLIPVSRGKSIPSEVLGSGDATSAGQEFTLKKAPLTYLASGDGYRSTLRVYVDQVEWLEVPSFYGQPHNANVFVTKEDGDAKTHVIFGDGINGARLPSGTSNVMASYRYGSGAELPDAGSLTVVTTPRPGLRGIRNPVGAYGGSDPDAPEKIRRYAPRSVLTFGRAVSGDDYEVIAAGAPGVDRARAVWSFNAAQQRAMVTIYVGDTPGSLTAARDALRTSSDPNRFLSVLPAVPVDCTLTLTVVVSRNHLLETVKENVRRALSEPEHGLLGSKVVRIGQAFFISQVQEACLSVDGAVAVHGLSFTGGTPNVAVTRRDAGENGFFRLTTLTVSGEYA